jgi:hypothetical protein
MSNFPTSLDDDTTLPPINNNITEIGDELFNGVRDAIFNIEDNIGLTAAGSLSSLSERLGISIYPDGTIKPSAIASMGLVTLPIYNTHIASTAAISESKLDLDHSTQDLYNYTRDLASNVNSGKGWISATGVKLNPHISGDLYRHNLEDITVGLSSQYLYNKLGLARDNSNSYTLIDDINNELLHHQLADGTAYGTTSTITTNNGYEYSTDYAHIASGIFIDSSNFISVSSEVTDLQLLANFIDQSSIFLYGSRIQNFYANAISRKSRSSSLSADGYGQNIIPATTVTAYLRSNGLSSTTVDDIDTGDDIVEFFPETGVSDHTFDAKFSKVKPGDILKINYGSIETSFIVREKKYIQDGVNKKYVIRIAGKNLVYTESGIARIDRSLSNTSKFSNLSVSTANNIFSETPSLIVGSPRGASVLGIGFNPDLFDSSHYLLYLAIYTTGSPSDGYTILPPIDVTGNRGATPGLYTLESVVQSTNDQFRKAGYNYRFNAFTYGGEFGIMLSDSYNNCSFSILNVVVASDGSLDTVGTAAAFPRNVVGVFTSGSQIYAPDPLGFGTYGSNVASPAYMSTYGSAEASQFPTKVFSPLKRNNYYVNGIEREKLTTELYQVLDGYGDGYWVSEIVSQTIYPGPSPSGRVKTTYRVDNDLSTVELKAGKTIVVQPLTDGYFIDAGRFIIEEIYLGDTYTDITVYDSVHGAAISPSGVSGLGSQVALYFSSDSVSFNTESSTDFTVLTGFKAYFEAYIDESGKTFTHQRARLNISGSNMTMNEGITLYTSSELSKLNIVEVSPKLRGYQFGSVTKITLNIANYNGASSSDGVYDGYLCYYDGSNVTHTGPLVSGKRGSVTRFYDETHIDFIDVFFDLNTAGSNVTDQLIDIQLFPTLALDEDLMLLATCQFNDVTNSVSQLRDRRQFGNISEKELSISALNFISASDRMLHANGVIKGFEYAEVSDNPIDNQIYLNGGVALVNGKLIYVNNQTVAIPILKESKTSFYDINWAVCVNDKGEYQPIPLLDYDAALDTPTSVARVMKAFNPANGSTYYVDASTFSNIVNNRKDLTILYIVASTVNHLVSPATISLNITDARKYVNDSDSNFSLKLTTDTAQGNFKTIASIINWIKFNNTFNGTAIVRGANGINGIIDTELTLDFDSSVVIDGEENAIITVNQPMTLGSNITFKNLAIIFNAGLNVSTDASNITFDNCTISYIENVDFDAPTDNVIFDFNSGSNILFKDCSISVLYVREVSGGTTFKLTNVSDFNFVNTDVTVTYNVIADVVVPGEVFSLISSSGTSITKSSFAGNFSQFMIIDSSDDLIIDNVSITSSYNPNISSPADLDYVSANLVNHTHGFIYSDVSSTLDNIYINNTSFNYNPTVASADRFSFITFELTAVNSILSNLTVTNCKFNHLNISNSIEDVRPAVAIINTTSVTPAVYTSQQPILLNALIKNNNCNRNQSIILTSIALSSVMNYPGLVTVGCEISNNICGAIGYWTSSGSKVLSISPNISSLTDKDAGLLIVNNSCHYIYTSDYDGSYWDPFSNTEATGMYPSGNVSILNNRTSWIHNAITYEENSSLKIKNNYLSAYDTDFLSSFGSSSTGAYAIYTSSNKASVPSTDDPGEGNDTNCEISGNIITRGYWLSSISLLTTYNYSTAGIYTLCSANITNNVIKNITGNASNTCIKVGGLHNIVKNNRLYRYDNDMASYITISKGGNTSWDGLNSSGIVSGNYFDSPYIDSSLDETTIYYDNNRAEYRNWVVEKNINQTVTLSLPLTNRIFSKDTAGFAGIDSNTDLSYYITRAPSLQYGYKSPVLRVHDGYATATTRYIGWQENIDKYIPIGSRVISASVAVRGFGSQVTTSSPASHIYLYLNKYADNSSYLLLDQFDTTPPTPTTSASAAGDYDTYIENEVVATMSAANINALADTDTYLLTATTSGSDRYFVSGLDYSFSVSLDIELKRSSSTVDFYISPVIVKYRW